MTTWTSEELDKIGSAEELDIASLRSEGSLRKPVTIWVVRIGDELYIRAYKGRTSPWFKGTQVRHEGHVQAGGVDKDVTFVEVDGDAGLAEQIDTAYRTKYSQYAGSVLDSMVTPGARAATIKLVPR